VAKLIKLGGNLALEKFWVLNERDFPSFSSAQHLKVEWICLPHHHMRKFHKIIIIVGSKSMKWVLLLTAWVFLTVCTHSHTILSHALTEKKKQNIFSSYYAAKKYFYRSRLLQLGVRVWKIMKIFWQWNSVEKLVKIISKAIRSDFQLNSINFHLQSHLNWLNVIRFNETRILAFEYQEFVCVSFHSNFYQLKVNKLRNGKFKARMEELISERTFA
jgi:hypothetical protein